MGRIYSVCGSTIAWLGIEYDDSATAMKFIREISRKCYAAPAGDLEYLMAMLNAPEYHPKWIALDKLFRRPWWSRPWITQEFVLPGALQFVCGSLSLLCSLSSNSSGPSSYDFSQ